MRLRCIVIIWLAISAVSAFAQVDSLNADTIPEPKKWKFLFSFDSRSSSIRFSGDKYNAKLFGVKIGASYKEKHRFGWGVYWLQSDKTPIIVPDKYLVRTDSLGEKYLDTVEHHVTFGYQTLFYEYVIYRKGRWEISAPVHLGFGVAEVNARNGRGPDTLLGKFGSALTSFAVDGHYKISPWLGVGAGFGYRLMLTHNKDISKALNAPYTIFKIKLFLGDLYRGMFKRKEGYRLTYKKCKKCYY